MVLQLTLHETACQARLLAPDGSVLALEVDERLGSADAIEPVAQFLASVFEGVHGVGLRRTPTAWVRLWEIARTLLDSLMSQRAASVSEEFPGPPGVPPRLLEVEMTREGLDEMLAPFVEGGVRLVEKVLAGRPAEPLPEFDLDGDVLPLSFLAEHLWARYRPSSGEPAPDFAPVVASSTPPVSPGEPSRSAPEKPEPSTAPLPPELLERCGHFARRVAEVAPRIHPEDLRELQAELAVMSRARDSGDSAALSASLESLDDLLFLLPPVQAEPAPLRTPAPEAVPRPRTPPRPFCPLTHPRTSGRSSYWGGGESYLSYSSYVSFAAAPPFFPSG
ncbi:MAG: hypothetical protein FJ109_11495 [Deltaproteobacteria bacterium]|nr:hypothetical protein [Deltaproteobacteria bacterium]